MSIDRILIVHRALSSEQYCNSTTTSSIDPSAVGASEQSTSPNGLPAPMERLMSPPTPSMPPLLPAMASPATSVLAAIALVPLLCPLSAQPASRRLRLACFEEHELWEAEEELLIVTTIPRPPRRGQRGTHLVECRRACCSRVDPSRLAVDEIGRCQLRDLRV